MAESVPSAPRRRWLVPLGLALWFTLVHGRAVDSGVLSDSWSMLLAASRPWGEALAHSYRYHTIPITNLLTLVEWRLFGLHELPYQLLNLAGVLSVGWLFHRFTRRLTGDGRIALLAVVLWIANASYFQIVYWPVVGTFQSLGVVFYLLALGAVQAGQPGRFALFSALAFFTYEPMVSVVAVGVVFALAKRAPPGRSSWLLAAGAVGLLIVAVKIPAVLGQGELVTPARGATELGQRLGLAARATYSTLSLRAATPSLGLGFDHPLVAGAWLSAFLALGAWAARRGTRATRFALGWFLFHLVLLTVSTRIASRHLYLLALPAALLLATALLRIHERLPRRLATPAVALLLALMVFAAGRDLGRADRAHELATAASRDLHVQLDALVAAGRPVDLIDLPAIVGSEGVPAFAFLNGTHARLELVHVESFDRRSVRLWTSGPLPPGAKIYANGSRPLTLGALDEGSAVLHWDPALHRVVPRL